MYVIIVGFSASGGVKTLFHHADPDAEEEILHPVNINAYLAALPDMFIYGRNMPLSNVPLIVTGSQPIDGGNYLFSDSEMREFIAKEPSAEELFHPWMGSVEFLNNKKRWVLWLGDLGDEDLDALPMCRERVERVRSFRLTSKRVQTVKAAEFPTRFGSEVLFNSSAVVVPQVSSERRMYIPIGFIGPDVFCSDC